MTAATPTPAGRGEVSQRSFRHLFATTVLGCEAFVVAFAGLVAFGLKTAPPARIWLVVGIGAAVCLLAAGVARRPAGLAIGSLVQVGLILSGLALPTMWFVGGVFAVLWVVGLWLGGTIDREKKAYVAAHPEEFAD